MAAKLEIILEDKSPAAAPAAPGTPAPIQPASVGPASPSGQQAKPPGEVAGKKKADQEYSDVAGIVKDISGIFGLGGIASAAIKLIDAFRKLDSQVANTTEKLRTTADKQQPTEIETLGTVEAPTDRPFKSSKFETDHERYSRFIGNEPSAGTGMAKTDYKPDMGLSVVQPGQMAEWGFTGNRPAEKSSTFESLPEIDTSEKPSPVTSGAAAFPSIAALGVAAAAVTGVAVAVVGFGAAISAAMSKIKSLTDELETYSGAVAVAAGQSQLREELASIRRGQTIGPDLARVENLRSRAQDEAARIMDGFYSAILKMLVRNEDKIESAINILSKVADNSVVITEGMLKGLDFYTDLVPVFAANKFAFQQALKLLGNIDDNTKDKEPDDDPLVDEWLKQFGQPALNGVGRPMGGKP